MGGLARYLLRSVKAASASGVHLKGPDFFISLKKGSVFSPDLEMKHPRAAMHLVSRCMSLSHSGGCISSMALILSGLASMPR